MISGTLQGIESLYNSLAHDSTSSNFTNIRCELAVGCTTLTTVIPAILAVIAMTVQILELNKPVSIRANSESALKRDMTIMIVLLTSVFFVCNTANIGSPFVSGSCGAARRQQQVGYIMGYTLGCVLPFLNSLVSPVIVVARASQLRVYLIQRSRRSQTRNSTVVENLSAIQSRQSVAAANFRDSGSSRLSTINSANAIQSKSAASPAANFKVSQM